MYPGSADYYVTPLPSVSASYSRGNLSASVSLLEGVGVSYVIPQWGLIASGSLNAGPRRDSLGYSVFGVQVDHSAPTRSLLAGSKTLDTPIVLNAGLLRPTPIGVVGASVAVHPTSIGSEDEQGGTKTGLVYSLQYLNQLQVGEQLSFAGSVSVEFMNGTYADTWHTGSRNHLSNGLHEAGAGMRGTTFAVEAKYWVSERVSIAVLGASTFLLSDARNSPYTGETTQRAMLTQVLYHF